MASSTPSIIVRSFSSRHRMTEVAAAVHGCLQRIPARLRIGKKARGCRRIAGSSRKEAASRITRSSNSPMIVGSGQNQNKAELETSTNGTRTQTGQRLRHSQGEANTSENKQKARAPAWLCGKNGARGLPGGFAK